MLPNYLADIKSSGFYRFVFDKSEMPGQTARTLRLVVGYSEKGPFNTPVYVEDQATFKQIFGGRSKKLERYGMWFHRLALQALKAGPIICLNLKNFDTENEKDNRVDFTTFNPSQTIFNTDEEEQIAENLTMLVNQLYDTDRFWKLEPEHLEELGIEGIIPEDRMGYITITNTDSKDNSCTVFMRGYEPKGFDVPFMEWYSAVLNGEDLPSYLEGHERDLVSQYFAEIFIFKGEFTPEIAASEKLAKFFNVDGDEVTLKPYILNAFGEKIDTLSALAQNDASNFLRSYNGILLPEFRNASNTVISLDAQVNADNYIHKLMMRLNQDMLYNIDLDDPDSFQISDIDTTGWNIGPKNIEKYRPMCLTQVDPVIYTATFEDGEWNYIANEGHEGEAADFYTYEGLEPVPADEEADEYTMMFNDEDSRFGATGIKQGESIYIEAGEDSTLAHVVNITENEVEEDTEEVVTPINFTVVHNEASWNEAYGDGETTPLAKYYQKYPMEDLWNQTAGRAANFNDRQYVGTIEDTEVTTEQITWYTDNVQKVQINGTTYYASMFYSMDPCTIELYTDESLETLYNTFVIESIGYQNCVHCWEGTINAPGAKLPWAVVDSWENGKLGLTVDDVTVYPWGEEASSKEWGVASLPTEFADTEVEIQTIDPANQEATDTFDPSTLDVDSTSERVIPAHTEYQVQFDKPVADMEEPVLNRCMGSMTATSAYMKPLYLKGYVYEKPKPESTRQEDKLEWQHYMLDTLTNYKGLREALTNRVDISYRYLVDTFEGFVESNCKARLAAICKAKDNTFGILNFPSLKSFSKCTYTSFRNEKNEFDTKYIPQGGNSLKPMAQMFTLPSQEDGASWVGFYTSVNIRDVNTAIKETVPSAALVSNNFMLKYSKYLPYTIIAGTNRGVVSEPGLQGPDFNFSRKDLDNLEPFGVNCMVYVDNKGTVINSNQTAKQNPVTALSKVHVRELCIFLQDEIEKLLEDYHWDFNTPALRDRIKERADVILETCKNNGGVYAYFNECSDRNNTDDVINNEMLVLSTSIEPGMGCGKMVQTLTLYRKGGMDAFIAEQ